MINRLYVILFLLCFLLINCIPTGDETPDCVRGSQPSFIISIIDAGTKQPITNAYWKAVTDDGMVYSNLTNCLNYYGPSNTWGNFYITAYCFGYSKASNSVSIYNSQCGIVGQSVTLQLTKIEGSGEVEPFEGYWTGAIDASSSVITSDIISTSISDYQQTSYSGRYVETPTNSTQCLLDDCDGTSYIMINGTNEVDIAISGTINIFHLKGTLVDETITGTISKNDVLIGTFHAERY